MKTGGNFHSSFLSLFPSLHSHSSDKTQEMKGQSTWFSVLPPPHLRYLRPLPEQRRIRDEIIDSFSLSPLSV